MDAVGTEITFQPGPGIYQVTATAMSVEPGLKSFEMPLGPGVTHNRVVIDTFAPKFQYTAPALPLPPYAKYFAEPKLVEGAPYATFELVAAPAGATINAATGRVEWSMKAFGPQTFTVKATNPFGEGTLTWQILVSPDLLKDDFDSDPLANPFWGLSDVNPGTVFTTADGKFSWDQPRVGTSGNDFDNWCGFNRTPFLYYPTDSLMDFSIQCRLDITRVDAGACPTCSHHGLQLEIPGRDLTDVRVDPGRDPGRGLRLVVRQRGCHRGLPAGDLGADRPDRHGRRSVQLLLQA